MTNADLRTACDVCGELYFPTSQSEQCPHDYNSTRTKAAMRELRALLHREDNAQ